MTAEFVAIPEIAEILESRAKGRAKLPNPMQTFRHQLPSFQSDGCGVEKRSRRGTFRIRAGPVDRQSHRALYGQSLPLGRYRAEPPGSQAGAMFLAGDLCIFSQTGIMSLTASDLH